MGKADAWGRAMLGAYEGMLNPRQATRMQYRPLLLAHGSPCLIEVAC